MTEGILIHHISMHSIIRYDAMSVCLTKEFDQSGHICRFDRGMTGSGFPSQFVCVHHHTKKTTVCLNKKIPSIYHHQHGSGIRN